MIRASQRLTSIAGLLILGLALAACGSTAAGSTATSGGCTPKHHFPTIQQGTLTISVLQALPYIGYDDVNSKLQGTDGQVMDAIAKMECLKTSVQVLGGTAIQAVVSNRADISLGGWYVTDERAKVVGQTDPVYYDFNSIVSKTGISKVSDLKGQKVGCVGGTLFVAPLQQLLGAGNVVTYQGSDAVMADIDSGRIQAAVLGSGEAAYLNKQRGGTDKVLRITPESDYPPSEGISKVDMPYTKSNTALGAALNDDIKTLRADGTVKKALLDWGWADPNNFAPVS